MLAADWSDGTCERPRFLLSGAPSPRPHLGPGLRRRVGRSRRQTETPVGTCPLLEFGWSPAPSVRVGGGGGFRGVAGCRRGSLVLEGVPGQTLYHVEQVLHVGVCRHVCHTNRDGTTSTTFLRACRLHMYTLGDLHCPPRYLTVTFWPTRVEASIVPLNGTREFS